MLPRWDWPCCWAGRTSNQWFMWCKRVLEFLCFPSSFFDVADVLSNLLPHAIDLDTVEMHAALMSETCMSALEAAHPTGCQWPTAPAPHQSNAAKIEWKLCEAGIDCCHLELFCHSLGVSYRFGSQCARLIESCHKQWGKLFGWGIHGLRLWSVQVSILTGTRIHAVTAQITLELQWFWIRQAMGSSLFPVSTPSYT